MKSKVEELVVIIGYAVGCSVIGALAGLLMAYLVTLVGSLDSSNAYATQHWLSNMGMVAMSFGSILGAIFGAQFGFRATK